VLWSAGKEGSVRWWGGKTAKILSKSALCEGEVSALEMDETVVVAGYSGQGMEAWDVRTQQPLCTFSNGRHGGVRSLQFDSRKLVSVSSNGEVRRCGCVMTVDVWSSGCLVLTGLLTALQAALWRWYSPNPVRWFEPPSPSTKYISAQFNDRHLVLGTDSFS
jgi:hypothetical protein